MNNSYTTQNHRSRVVRTVGSRQPLQAGHAHRREDPITQVSKGRYAYNPKRNNRAPSVGAPGSASLGKRRREVALGPRKANRDPRRLGMAFSAPACRTSPACSAPTGASRRRCTTARNNSALPMLLRDNPALPAPRRQPPGFPSAGTDSLKYLRRGHPARLIPSRPEHRLAAQVEPRHCASKSATSAAAIVQDWETGQHQRDRTSRDNGFVNESGKAQANLQANIAAGRGATFAYTGAVGHCTVAHFPRLPQRSRARAAPVTRRM